MAVATSIDEFLDLFRKSQLVDAARIDSFVKGLGDQVPTQPRALAEAFARQGLLTPFQAGMLLNGKWRGFFLAGGKYKLLQLLGVGGMGKVYLCEHVRMKRLVALKVLPQDQTKDAGAVERFDREATAAAALNHPNIVRAFDIDRDGEVHFLVMEYVDGSSLQEIVKKHGPLDIHRACHYVSQAALGLQHAHESGWVHRDIKPGNLLLDRTGKVRILDMGLARFLQDTTGRNITERYDNKATLGTADYLAPEQAVNSHEVDIRADIYSLGATLYYLLTGRAPFESGSIPEKLVAHQLREPESVTALRPEVPKPLSAVLKRMMAKKAVHRYQTPLAVVEALEPWTQTRIDLPADEEMPRLCTALETYLGVGANGPMSGVIHSGSGRMVGPRSSAYSSGRLAAGPRSSWWSRVQQLRGGPLYGAIGGAAALVVLLGIGLWKLFSNPAPKSPDSNQQLTQRQTQSHEPSVPTRTSVPTTKPKPIPAVIPTPSAEVVPNTGTIHVGGSAPANGGESAPNLAAALAQAKPGRRILLMEPTIEGAIVIDDAARLAGVTIESGLSSGRRVVWNPPADHPADQPLLEIIGVPNVQVRGLQLGGKRMVNSLVRTRGACPGTMLQDLQLIDFAADGIELIDLPSALEKPILINRVRILPFQEYAQLERDRSGDVRPSAIVVRSTTAPAGTGPALIVRDSRIEGIYKAAVAFGGPIYAEVFRNRLYTMKDDERPASAQNCDAFLVSAAAMKGGTRLTLAANSVARYPNFVRFDAAPGSGGPPTKVAIRNNLMVGGTSWALGRNGESSTFKSVHDGSGGNVSRPNTCLRGLAIPHKAVDFGYLDISLGDDMKFLRYPKSHVLATAGVDDGPAGFPPD